MAGIAPPGASRSICRRVIAALQIERNLWNPSKCAALGSLPLGGSRNPGPDCPPHGRGEENEPRHVAEKAGQDQEQRRQGKHRPVDKRSRRLSARRDLRLDLPHGRQAMPPQQRYPANHAKQREGQSREDPDGLADKDEARDLGEHENESKKKGGRAHGSSCPGHMVRPAETAKRRPRWTWLETCLHCLSKTARGRSHARSSCEPIAGMSGFFDVYSIIFLVIAVVIFMRLGSVLGRRTGNEPSPYDPRVKTPPSGARNDNVVSLPPRERGPLPTAGSPDLEPIARYSAPGTPLHDSLVAIAKNSSGFDLEHFVAGSKAAYEMIVTAFAEGERPTLKNLLAPEVFEGFVTAIAEREERQQRSELTFVGIEEAKIMAAELDGRTGRITIRFVSELISCTRDKDGNVVEGDPTDVQTIRDVWTFARDVGSRDPNWKLVSTETV